MSRKALQYMLNLYYYQKTYKVSGGRTPNISMAHGIISYMAWLVLDIRQEQCSQLKNTTLIITPGY